VNASTDAVLQIRDIIVTAPDPVRSKYRVLQGKPLIAALAKIRPQDRDDPLTGHTLIALRALARRVQQLRAEIAEHEQALAGLVTRVNPALLQATGIGVVSAADLLIAAGDNPDRINSEAAFAALCGASPIPASSGQITRHRLNRGGNRHANCALHRIAVVRLHTDARTRAYANRKRATGKTNKEILRCLKRAIAREVYHLIANPPTPIDTGQLRPTRQAAGLTLAAAAHDLQCSIATLSYIERGRSSNREKITAYRDYLNSQQDAA
jgi:transposase